MIAVDVVSVADFSPPSPLSVIVFVTSQYYAPREAAETVPIYEEPQAPAIF